MTRTQITKAQAVAGVVVGWFLVLAGCAVAVTGFAIAVNWVGIVGLIAGIAGAIVVAAVLRRRSVR